jgi:hypothetical protein
VINPDHLDMLAKSGVTEEFAMARGYETILDRRRLADLKITPAGRNTPGLLIPLLRVDGSTFGYQYRPDMPRLRDGKAIKYETPFQQRNGLDIPPGVNAQLGDPDVPLFITEGSKRLIAAPCTACASSTSSGCGTGCAPTPPAARWRCPNGGTAHSTMAAA